MKCLNDRLIDAFDLCLIGTSRLDNLVEKIFDFNRQHSSGGDVIDPLANVRNSVKLFFVFLAD